MKTGDLFPVNTVDFNRYGPRFKRAYNYRGEYTGEKRVPEKGEWYLSGAVIETWYAIATLQIPYCIAVIVPIKVITIKEVTA